MKKIAGHKMTACMIFISWVLLCPAFLYAADVAFVISKNAAPYHLFVDAARKEIRASGKTISTDVIVADDYPLSKNRYRLLVAVGSQATRDLVNSNHPHILSAMIPSSVYLELSPGAGKALSQNTSAIYINHPLRRNISFIRKINASWNKIGLLTGANNTEINNQVVSVARMTKTLIRHDTVNDSSEVVKKLNNLLSDSQVLLTLADPVVLNSTTAHGILLSAYHKKVPVISYIKSYVKAGALAALYSTPEELGKQAGEYILNASNYDYRFERKIQYPRYYSVTINQRVAHSLGLDNLDEKKIRDALYRMEGAE